MAAAAERVPDVGGGRRRGLLTARLRAGGESDRRQPCKRAERESCLNCHKPHGSNEDKLLVTPLPLLCQECHSPIDNPNFGHPSGMVTSQNMATGVAPDDRLMNRGCLNCHSQIHGSNNPSGPRFHR